MAVVTSVVAQNTTGVHHVEHLSLESIEKQLHDDVSDIMPQAVKTGHDCLTGNDGPHLSLCK